MKRIALDDSSRDVVLAELNMLSGQVFPAQFFRQKRTNTAVKGTYEYHNLIRGIYKPQGCELAISVIQAMTGPYSDTLRLDSRNIWSLEYAEQGRGKRGWDNISLARCVNNLPIAVIVQRSSKVGLQGSKYEVLGLGRVERYDTTSGVFKITQWQGPIQLQMVNPTEDDILKEAKSIGRLLEKPFEPFEKKSWKMVKQAAREAAFTRQVLSMYDGTCAACGSRWIVDANYEVQAAHIISKRANGTDDPRNGVAFCRFHHWAFDRGLFSINNDYNFMTTSKLSEFSRAPEGVAKLSGKTMFLPSPNEAAPHKNALEWHRRTIFRCD